MAFIDTSDSIIIDAALTEKGRKHLARGTFNISKFALGDDEIDYSLCDKDSAAENKAGFKHSSMFEACTNSHKNIQYGLNSFDKGILYLRHDELSHPDFDPVHPHAFLLYLPILKQNTILKSTPSIADSVYYISVNNETTRKINQMANDSSITAINTGFRFIQSNQSEKIKFIVESGIDVVSSLDPDPPQGNYEDRKRYIAEKFLLDQDLLIYVDDRFTQKVLSNSRLSKFQNFPSGQSSIEFVGLKESPPISLENQFDNYATYVVKTIDNLICDFDSADTPSLSISFSDIRGPRGTVAAFSIKVAPEMKTNSTGTRDLRYSDFGKTDQVIFGGSEKFDHIDTAIYVVGATTNSQIQIPIRIIRYSGT